MFSISAILYLLEKTFFGWMNITDTEYMNTTEYIYGYMYA